MRGICSFPHPDKGAVSVLGKIMLLASHNAPDLTMACDKVYEFKDKHLVQGGDSLSASAPGVSCFCAAHWLVFYKSKYKQRRTVIK